MQSIYSQLREMPDSPGNEREVLYSLEGSFSPVPSNRRSLDDSASRQLPIQLYLTTMTTYALGGRPVTQYCFRTVKTVTSVESRCTHNFLVPGGGELRGWTI